MLDEFRRMSWVELLRRDQLQGRQGAPDVGGPLSTLLRADELPGVTTSRKAQ